MHHRFRDSGRQETANAPPTIPSVPAGNPPIPARKFRTDTIKTTKPHVRLWSGLLYSKTEAVTTAAPATSPNHGNQNVGPMPRIIPWPHIHEPGAASDKKPMLYIMPPILNIQMPAIKDSTNAAVGRRSIHHLYRTETLASRRAIPLPSTRVL